jgi:HPt (histidine-containing phosphotransfer) domain-containing protein
VDLERLLEFTDGSPDNLRELVALYLKETRNQLEQLESAVGSGAPAEARRLAHSCAGASATCGMRRLAPLLRELERQSAEEDLAGAGRLCQEAGREFERIRKFLEEYLAKQPDLVSKP